MLHQDYLMRMFLQLATAIRESYQRARKDDDPLAAAELIEASLENATEIDGALLLRMAPETMAAMLQLSDPDPQLMEYVSRSLLLSSQYLQEGGQQDQAQLRAGQAYAVAQAFGVSLDPSCVEASEMDELFSRTLPASEE